VHEAQELYRSRLLTLGSCDRKAVDGKRQPLRSLTRSRLCWPLRIAPAFPMRAG